MISPTFDKNSGLLKLDYKGVISLEEIYKMADYIENNDELPRNLKILQDGYEAEFRFEPFKLKKIMRRMEEIAKKYDSIRAASLNSKPLVVAYGKLFSSFIRLKKLSYEIFYTEEAALEWLHSFDKNKSKAK